MSKVERNKWEENGKEEKRREGKEGRRKKGSEVKKIDKEEKCL